MRKPPKRAPRKREAPAGRKTAAAEPKKTYSTTYRVASNVTRIAMRLLLPPRQMTYNEVRRLLPPDLSDKTVGRYVSALQNVFDGRDRNPKLEVDRYDEGVRVLRLVEPERDAVGDPLDQLQFAIASELLTAVRGTHLESEVKELLSKFSAASSPALSLKLETMRRKFFTVSYGMKEYDGPGRERLNVILRCLIEQQRMRVAYRSQDGGGALNDYDFDPYTLLTYKGGLYLIGYSFKREKTIYLAVERIERVEPVVENGQQYLFRYPEEYSPEKFTEGVFGIFSGPKTAVELRVRSGKTVTYLRPRRIHPTQKLVEQPDGTAILTMTVRGTEELATWVLGMSPWVEVVKPESLREQVRRRLAEGLRAHGGGGGEDGGGRVPATADGVDGDGAGGGEG